MSLNRTLYQILSLGILLMLPQLSRAETIRIGFVDLRKALNSVEDGKKAKAILEKRKRKFQALLNKKQRELKRQKKLYEAKAAILRGQAKKREQLKLQRKFFELQQLYGKLTRELAKAEAIETTKIFMKMQVIINQIARENNLILMLEKTESSVLYARPEMDYTNELIRRYNRLYGSKGKKRGRRIAKRKARKKYKK